jgi:hypothetical protein
VGFLLLLLLLLLPPPPLTFPPIHQRAPKSRSAAAGNKACCDNGWGWVGDRQSTAPAVFISCAIATWSAASKAAAWCNARNTAAVVGKCICDLLLLAAAACLHLHVLRVAIASCRIG